MVLPRSLARFNRRVTNPVLGTLAGRVPPLAVVEHRGRRTGAAYRTPVLLFHAAGRYRIALTYGPDTDWVRNVTAAPEFVLYTRGAHLRVGRATVHRDPSADWAPPVVRDVLRAMEVRYYLEAESLH
ncbi:nitroreductase family deazaflavin-dependent oxidoreductase [Nocardia thailandica]|uniref:Nitroreductase family deazaflavin-dependent oxidoreductase n=1 Tax=Nocardia thailandica TaxID=257275 RepID=A0ABW6PNE6_9NOCA|nr:nitroreductase family deazaflavin-dependent oxidoreductase [Nocardia thailandica]